MEGARRRRASRDGLACPGLQPGVLRQRASRCDECSAVRPVTVVLAYWVAGRDTQVLPPSMLDCHSYEARRAAESVTSLTEPETSPGLAAKTRGARAAVFFTPVRRPGRSTRRCRGSRPRAGDLPTLPAL